MEQTVSLFGMRDEGTPFKEHFHLSLGCIAYVLVVVVKVIFGEFYK